MLVVTLLTLPVTAATADVYKWVDKNGAAHFSDIPPQGIESRHIQLSPTDASTTAPDEGELRRRRLLENADSEATRRIKAQQARSAAKQAQQAAELERKKHCLEAREALAVLQEKLPVYRDDEGKLRNSWAYDTYKGKRTYISDAARPAEISRVQEQIKRLCAQPDDEKKQDLARKQMIRSAYCAAARADLQALERPNARTPPQALEAKRKQVEFYCREPAEEDL